MAASPTPSEVNRRKHPTTKSGKSRDRQVRQQHDGEAPSTAHRPGPGPEDIVEQLHEFQLAISGSRRAFAASRTSLGLRKRLHGTQRHASGSMDGMDTEEPNMELPRGMNDSQHAWLPQSQPSMHGTRHQLTQAGEIQALQQELNVKTRQQRQALLTRQASLRISKPSVTASPVPVAQGIADTANGHAATAGAAPIDAVDDEVDEDEEEEASASDDVHASGLSGSSHGRDGKAAGQEAMEAVSHLAHSQSWEENSPMSDGQKHGSSAGTSGQSTPNPRGQVATGTTTVAGPILPRENGHGRGRANRAATPEGSTPSSPDNLNCGGEGGEPRTAQAEVEAPEFVTANGYQGRQMIELGMIGMDRDAESSGGSSSEEENPATATDAAQEQHGQGQQQGGHQQQQQQRRGQGAQPQEQQQQQGELAASQRRTRQRRISYHGMDEEGSEDGSSDYDESPRRGSKPQGSPARSRSRSRSRTPHASAGSPAAASAGAGAGAAASQRRLLGPLRLEEVPALFGCSLAAATAEQWQQLQELTQLLGIDLTGSGVRAGEQLQQQMLQLMAAAAAAARGQGAGLGPGSATLQAGRSRGRPVRKVHLRAQHGEEDTMQEQLSQAEAMARFPIGRLEAVQRKRACAAAASHGEDQQAAWEQQQRQRRRTAAVVQGGATAPGEQQQAAADVHVEVEWSAGLDACLFEPGSRDVVPLGRAATARSAAMRIDLALLALRGAKGTPLNCPDLLSAANHPQLPSTTSNCRLVQKTSPNYPAERKTGDDLVRSLMRLSHGRPLPRVSDLVSLGGAGRRMRAAAFGCGRCLVCTDPRSLHEMCLRQGPPAWQQAPSSLQFLLKRGCPTLLMLEHAKEQQEQHLELLQQLSLGRPKKLHPGFLAPAEAHSCLKLGQEAVQAVEGAGLVHRQAGRDAASGNHLRAELLGFDDIRITTRCLWCNAIDHERRDCPLWLLCGDPSDADTPPQRTNAQIQRQGQLPSSTVGLLAQQQQGQADEQAAQVQQQQQGQADEQAAQQQQHQQQQQLEVQQVQGGTSAVPQGGEHRHSQGPQQQCQDQSPAGQQQQQQQQQQQEQEQHRQQQQQQHGQQQQEQQPGQHASTSMHQGRQHHPNIQGFVMGQQQRQPHMGRSADRAAKGKQARGRHKAPGLADHGKWCADLEIAAAIPSWLPQLDPLTQEAMVQLQLAVRWSQAPGALPCKEYDPSGPMSISSEQLLAMALLAQEAAAAEAAAAAPAGPVHAAVQNGEAAAAEAAAAAPAGPVHAAVQRGEAAAAAGGEALRGV